jgi:type VI secretion system protein VasG
MAEILRETLFRKLDPLGYQTLLSAIGFANTRGHATVELAHWIWQILQEANSDLHCVMRTFKLDASRLETDLTAALDRLRRGAPSVTNISSDVEEAVEQGWKYASLMFAASQVRTGHLIVALVKTRNLQFALHALSQEFAKIKPDKFTDEFSQIVQDSGEMVEAEATPATGPAQALPAGDKQAALAKFSFDLTEKARRGELDPIAGRDEEIRQLVDILMRRRQNNPILTGEAGVGKTAVVEGFAQRIVAGDVPPDLKRVCLRTLDIGLLQAGASMKGEFEQRLRNVIEEVEKARLGEHPVILFIDEAHTLIGAGGAAGTGDAANLLKPALARGTLRTIAATTWNEYKLHIEKDPALTRRFQVVKVDEPSEAKALLMMRNIAAPLEKHHRVQILDQALEAAVRLSHRYIAARQLPDKAVSLLDTAAARVAVSHHAAPAAVEDCRRRIQALQVEQEIIDRELSVGIDHQARAQQTAAALTSEKVRCDELEKRWTEEKDLVTKMLDLRAKLLPAGSAHKKLPTTTPPQTTAKPEEPPTATQRETLLAELKSLQQRLAEFQGESPLVFPCVDENAVASVVGDWTGIPVGRMMKNEIEQVLLLADHLERRVIGQRHALETIAKRVRTTRAKLDNPNRPIGVFLLAGPSGVGKTETALALAETLYGGEHSLIAINMSEFQESHTVSTLKGSPPGYVGYGKGGVLTEAVRRRPYSVVLLDEVEKAHRDVHEIFFQVFDKGWMEDAEGVYIDFKNTIIILTTNAAQDVIINMCKDPDLLPEAEGLEKALREPLLKTFPDALLNRLLVVPYYPISQAMLRTIIKLNLSRVAKRIEQNHKIPLVYDDSVPELIASRCAELERGARIVDALITNTLLPAIGQEMLTRLMKGVPMKQVNLGTQDGNFTFAFD